MATIRDVARAAGVSIATVSRAFNDSPHVTEDTLRRVWEAADELDYWPNGAARSLTTNRTHAIGVLLPDLYGEFFSEVIRGIDLTARTAKYQTLISSFHAETEAVLAAARSMRGRVDGFIVMAPDVGSGEAIDRIIQKFPVVLLNPRFEIGGCGTVSIANYEGAYQIVRHLLGLGHRRIAMIKGPTGNIDAEERLRGYQDALPDFDMEGPSRLEFEGEFTEASGYEAGRQILEVQPRPTAVFSANDNMTIGLMSIFSEAGVRIPEDMAVVGFDDIEIAKFTRPPLTTVRVDASGLGRRAFGLLLETMESAKPPQPRHEVVEAKLIVRRSCGSKQVRGSRPSKEFSSEESTT